jgi:hypothetical protein
MKYVENYTYYKGHGAKPTIPSEARTIKEAKK